MRFHPRVGESATESEADNKAACDDEGGGFESAPEDEGVKADSESVLQSEESHSSVGHGSSQDHHRHYRPKGTNPDVSLASFASFDIQRLPLAYGPKTTEVLIDAIFNPILTTDKSKENPFTLYVSPHELERLGEAERRLLLDNHGGRPKTAPSMKSNGRSLSHATTISTTTTSSGSDSSHLEGMRSPGQDTVVGVASGQRQVLAGVPLNREHDVTIGGGGAEKQSSGVGGLLHSIQQKTRKDKGQEGSKKRGHPHRSDTMRTTSGNSAASATSPSMNVFGSPVFVQEPAGMDSEDAAAPQASGNLRRTGTTGTIESTLTNLRSHNSSSTSLSFVSRSGHGHGSPQARPSPISRPLTRQGTAASNDLSVPDGRMDRTGFVKGSHGGPSTTPTPAHGLGSGITRWWKGLGAHSSPSGAGHHKVAQTAVAS